MIWPLFAVIIDAAATGNYMVLKWSYLAIGSWFMNPKEEAAL